MPRPRPPSIIMVAGTSSGVGKTTLACGIMGALTRRGRNVAPFKVGPDFLDAMHHEAAIQAARSSFEPPPNPKPKRDKKLRKTINLDGWMMGGEESVVDCILRHCGWSNDENDDDDDAVDVCVIEGCMGLYDSKNGTCDDGSLAQIAKYMNALVVLVVDAGKMAQSVAPMALGYASFDEDVHFDSVIANKIREALEDLNTKQQKSTTIGASKLLFAGGMVRDQTVTIPSRHLGLTMPNEGNCDEQAARADRFLQLADLAEQHIHLDRILELGKQRGVDSPGGSV